jgi:hypothetical protein
MKIPRKELGMHGSGKTLCPLCAGETAETRALCRHCGQDLHGMRLAHRRTRPKVDFYTIIPYEEKFAVAIRGEVLIHSLDGADLEKAQGVVAILNSFIEGEKAGWKKGTTLGDYPPVLQVDTD